MDNFPPRVSPCAGSFFFFFFEGVGVGWGMYYVLLILWLGQFSRKPTFDLFQLQGIKAA